MSDRRAAVLGKPIAHSLSPVIHNAGYAAAGLAGWRYTAIECGESELPDLVAGLSPEWAGLSLTMPLKEAALTVADAVSPVAAAVGAANTLVRGERGWYADNTDAPGIVDALAAAGVRTATRVAVLGAGGTARAALAAAADLGADVTVYARRPAAIAELEPVADALGVTLTGASWDAAAGCADAPVVISTVPRGVADGLAGAVRWRPSVVLFDALYDPWPTPLAAAAARAGCPVVSGLDLLLAQAVRQFESFTGVSAPVEPMRAALAAARR
ncbi:shikimate dehydrogenase [Planosporangium sp. 12N6]|uniref:shikimate dehydrogenase n=1 Tax=Planosporangium spinosum TaxID=3402278 RepID=UPI003CF70F61